MVKLIKEIVLFSIVSLLIMLLWNLLLTNLFDFSKINFIQACGLKVLLNIIAATFKCKC